MEKLISMRNKVKLEIYEDLIEKICNKIDEIRIEYIKLLEKDKDLNTHNRLTHQYNSMRCVLEEIIEDLRIEIGDIDNEIFD